MRVLLTGNCGFIGSHLQEYLENKGYEVLGLDSMFWSTRKMRNSVIGDVRDKELVNLLVNQVDEVFHTAAQINVDYGNEHPDETVDINIKGTLNLLEACTKFNKPMVFASTSEVYGSQEGKISEETSTNCQSVYAASKLGADRLCKSYADTYSTDVKILRNFNTFGPYQRFDSYGGVISIFTDRALHNKPSVIYGDGKQERDYIWITDAVAGYELIAESGTKGQPINVGSGKTVTVNEIAEIIRKYTGCPKPIHTEPRPGEVRRLCCDNRKARGLGLVIETDFEKNIKEFIDWRKNYGK